MDSQRNIDDREKHNEAQILRERFYLFAKEYEVFPLQWEKSRYYEGILPEEFQRSFEFFVENEVMRTLKHFLSEFGHNKALFREKFTQYVLDLFEEKKRGMDEGSFFWNMDRDAGASGRKTSPLYQEEIEKFLRQYRESLLLVVYFSTAPLSELRLAPLGDMGKRNLEYISVLAEVGVKSRKILY